MNPHIVLSNNGGTETGNCNFDDCLNGEHERLHGNCEMPALSSDLAGGNVKYRILVIDDNQAIHSDYQKILQPNGTSTEFDQLEEEIFGESTTKAQLRAFEIDSAFQGQEGLALVKRACAERRPYSMAFVDLRMPPGWDGIETIEKIWKVDPYLQVVICTAYSDYSWNDIVHRLGHTDRFVILKKPFDILEIQQLAYSMTEKWRLAQSLYRHLDNLETTVTQRTTDLEKSVSLLNATLESTADGIYALSNEGKIVGTNKKFLELWDMPAELLEAGDRDQILQFIAARVQDPEGFLQRILEIYSDPERVDFEMIKLKDGRIFERYSQPQKLAKRIVGRVWSYRDVTKREQLSEQLRQTQKMESVGRLAGGVAHDFNNLLTVMQGHAALLLSMESSSEVAESHQQIYDAAERAANLTRQLLTFSRKQVMRLVTIDLNEVVRDMSKMLRRVLGEDIVFQIELAPDATLVNADIGMMEQVMMNLAVNARDAMSNGGTLTVQTSVVDVSETSVKAEGQVTGEFACLRITDTGSGISQEDLPHIFEPFFTTKGAGKGTGLGLATVYGIVKQHKGWINVRSVSGQGTTFEVFLPYLRRASMNSAAAPQEKVVGGNETILLVEDEAPVRNLVSTILTRLGYRVLEAETGIAAQKVWREHQSEIQLLLTDMVMPEGVSGRDLAKVLLAENPNLKVVFSSGYSRDLFGKDMLLEEGYNFLPKPYHPRQLASAVRKALDNETKPKSA